MDTFFGLLELLGECLDLGLQGLPGCNGLVTFFLQSPKLLLQPFHLSRIHTVVLLQNVLRTLLPPVPISLQKRHLSIFGFHNVFKFSNASLKRLDLLHEFIHASGFLRESGLGLLDLVPQCNTAFAEQVKFIEGIHKLVVTESSVIAISSRTALLLKLESGLVKLRLCVFELLAKAFALLRRKMVLHIDNLLLPSQELDNFLETFQVRCRTFFLVLGDIGTVTLQGGYLVGDILELRVEQRVLMEDFFTALLQFREFAFVFVLHFCPTLLLLGKVFLVCIGLSSHFDYLELQLTSFRTNDLQVLCSLRVFHQFAFVVLLGVLGDLGLGLEIFLVELRGGNLALILILQSCNLRFVDGLLFLQVTGSIALFVAELRKLSVRRRELSRNLLNPLLKVLHLLVLLLNKSLSILAVLLLGISDGL